MPSTKAKEMGSVQTGVGATSAGKEEGAQPALAALRRGPHRKEIGAISRLRADSIQKSPSAADTIDIDPIGVTQNALGRLNGRFPRSR